MMLGATTSEQTHAVTDDPQQTKQAMEESADVLANEPGIQRLASAADEEKTTATENVSGNEVVVTSDFHHIQQMMQAQNMTRGIAPREVSQDDLALAAEQQKS